MDLREWGIQDFSVKECGIEEIGKEGQIITGIEKNNDWISTQ